MLFNFHARVRYWNLVVEADDEEQARDKLMQHFRSAPFNGRVKLIETQPAKNKGVKNVV